MRRGTTHIFLAFSYLILSGCESNSFSIENSVERIQKNGELEIHTIDLGNIMVSAGQRNIAKANFKIENWSDKRNIQLVQSHKSCGCVSDGAVLTTIAPGEKGSVEVKYELASATSVESRSEFVEYETGLEEPSRIRFILKCNSYARLTIDPSKPIKESIVPGEKKLISVLATSLQQDQEILGEIKFSLNKNSNAELVGVKTLKEETFSGIKRSIVECQIKLSCPIEANGGYSIFPYSTELIAQFGDAKIVKRIYWEPKTAIKSSPTRCFVKVAPNVTSVTKTIVLSSKEPFSMRSVKSNDKWLTGKCELGIKKTEHELNIHVSGDLLLDASIIGRLDFETDHSRQPLFCLPVSVLQTE